MKANDEKIYKRETGFCFHLKNGSRTLGVYICGYGKWEMRTRFA
jgi:hypothetical protein